MHTLAIDVQFVNTNCVWICMHLLSQVSISALYCTTLCTHCATLLLCRIPHRWWLKVSAVSYDTSLLPFSSMDQREGRGEMEGEVVFKMDTKSNLLKAVSGTEWMYRRGALVRGRQVSVNAVVFVCGYKCGFFCMLSVSVCMFYRCPTDWLLSGPAYPLLKVTLPYWFCCVC